MKPCDENNIDNEIFAEEGCIFTETVPNGRQCGMRNTEGLDSEVEANMKL